MCPQARSVSVWCAGSTWPEESTWGPQIPPQCQSSSRSIRVSWLVQERYSHPFTAIMRAQAMAFYFNHVSFWPSTAHSSCIGTSVTRLEPYCTTLLWQVDVHLCGLPALPARSSINGGMMDSESMGFGSALMACMPAAVSSPLPDTRHRSRHGLHTPGHDLGRPCAPLPPYILSMD